MIHIDTESCGFFGPTILIQWAEDYGDIHLHNIFKRKVGDTLDLIDMMMTHKSGICGFNLSHDNYHFNRTYNILKELPRNHAPKILDYYDIESDQEGIHDLCVIPQTALDLMLVGRKTKFQSTLNQKDIVIKKVPAVLAVAVVQELHNKVEIPDICFAKSKKGYKWEIKRLNSEGKEEDKKNPFAPEDVDLNFVNLRLGFNPSTALKAIVGMILGSDPDTLEDFDSLPHPKEHGWWPCCTSWIDVIDKHVWEWTNDPRRLKYAENDIVYTRAVYDYLEQPQSGDTDSVLACAVGAMYWNGFTFDRDKAKKRKDELQKVYDDISKEINVNSPKQVVGWLHASCEPMEIQAIPNTKDETLQSLLEWKDDNPEVYRKVQKVFTGRRASKELDLLNKLLIAGRFYATYSVVGTKSNRMSGGSESYLKRGGSINPQGIKKGGAVRSIFTLADSDMVLCGGDFSGFEVSIAEAVYHDANLRDALLSGKKIHGLFGAEMYGLSYEEVMETEDVNDKEENGYYKRAKTGFFGSLYGAQAHKLSQAMWLSEEEAEDGLQRFKSKYPGIEIAQNKIFENFAALRQPDGIGTEIKWTEPAEYIESFLGFRRYFSLEFSIIKTLFHMAGNPSKELREMGKGIKVQRRDRIQTAGGATASALYAASFNLQSSVMRAAANHEIQSPGGQITKELQEEIWSVQPRGIHPFVVKPMNVHDEVQCPVLARKGGLLDETTMFYVWELVNKKVESYRELIPLIKMEWKTHLESWGH